MTLIASWAALQVKGSKKEISSMYILSDSRISWNKKETWDHARKVFNFSRHPDILGYCGEVLFITQVLSQIVTLGDSGFIFSADDSFDDKSQKIFAEITKLIGNYPEHKLFPSFSVIHCGKTKNGDFGRRILNWANGKGWEITDHSVEEISKSIICLGTGASEFKARYHKCFGSYNLSLSREVFQCFVITLSSIKDRFSEVRCVQHK